jgi:Na+-transporting NADH:ubiquinone oxidoreductase subunit A
MDTNPLAPDMGKILAGNEISLIDGIRVISNLTEGNLFINKSPDLDLPDIKLNPLLVTNFSGPHPAGNAGTHIHFLDPVNLHKSVWNINLQDVLAVGKLFTTGKIPVSRIISLAGPGVIKPRLLKTRIGGSIDDITRGELIVGKKRILSGSVLSGRQATETVNFLGRYHQQISVLGEVGKREFLGWLKPGLREYSVKNVVLSKMFRKRKFDFTTDKHGEERGIVPIGSYEKVMPLDILPTFLLRSLVINDVEAAQKLGCLELDEEDLALCTFVCPSKIEYGSVLRRNLEQIEKEHL